MNVVFSKLFHYLFSALLFITPLVMYPRTSELFEFNKMLFIYLITGFILSLWIARMLLLKKFVFRQSLLGWALLLFIASQVLSTIFSIDPHTSFYGYYGRFNGGLLSILAYAVLFYGYISNVGVTSAAQRRIQIESLLKVSLASSLFVMLWGLPSHFGYDPSCFVFTGSIDVSCWTDQFKPTIRVFSTLGQPNWFAAYLVIHILIGMYFYVKEIALKFQVAYGAYLLWAMTMLLYTRSRSGLVGLAVGAGIVAIYLLMKRDHYQRALKLQRSAMLVIMIALPIFFIGTGVQKVDTFIHVPTILRSLQPAEKSPPQPTGTAQPNITDSGDIRRIVWQGAFSLGMEYPLLGTGVETFGYSYNFIRPLEHNLTSEWDYVYNKAHNELFNYFATTGFVGLITYLLFFVLVMVYLRTLLNGSLSHEDSLLGVVLLGIFASIFVTNFFGFSTSTINVFYYLIPAWMVVLTASHKTKTPDDTYHVTGDDAFKLVVPACLAIVSMWFCVQYFRADTAYAYGDGLLNAQEFESSLPYLYKAYDIRKEHVYADKISQIHARQGGETCLDITGLPGNCMELSEKFNVLAQKGSPKNSLYKRTEARNNFLFFQATGDEKYYQAAIQAVDDARVYAPTDPRLPYLRALIALGRFESKTKPSDKDRQALQLSGLSSIEFAIKLKGDYTQAYYLKGLIQKSLKDTEGARKTFQYILDSLEPENEQVKQEIKNL